MKRITTLVLGITIVISGIAFADNGWNPGNPKPPIPEPDAWFLGIAGYFSDLWTYLMY